MPGATRVGDNSTGHDDCAPTSLVTGSPNVFINGSPAGRLGDSYAEHECEDHSAHQDSIASASNNVFINGLGAGRIGDSVAIGGAVAGGSNNVFINGD